MKQTQILFDKFINDEINEKYFVSKLDKDWSEVRNLASTHPEKFGLLLRKLSLPNRRRALTQAISLKTAELRRLLLGEFSKSSSTIADLYNQSKTRRFSNELLAKFGIIHRVTFDWVYKGEIRYQWDYKNFEFAGEVVSNMEDLVPLLTSSTGKLRDIGGYILRCNQMDCYFRIETREKAVIMDFYNHDLAVHDELMTVLKSTSFLWHEFVNRSVIAGYRYYTFVGVKQETDFNQLIENEYKFVGNINRLC
ncbi:hypothetical protein QNH46_17445 [Paenibacillus woosongensis]|uniref:Uncharacterized protein n=1 Tax=Paenibacillus woosongensis TaxID=307580 RepID=A0AA95L1I1_9BACL|nr:hypothetical protein [Paenibacillus woosongensis]WHX47907.1 hypothetical protein QNH46_17445 [Paenibacillus woosongensis]